jgi:alpha-tubulin suppressor-like RCC1 family protein
LFSFGSNEMGCLGLGDTKQRNTPTQINFFENLEIKNIFGGLQFTLVLLSNKLIILENGKLFGFGSNVDGQLGLGDIQYYENPTELIFFQNMNIKEIYCGAKHTFVVLGINIFKL